jgi:hypothetical protein
MMGDQRTGDQRTGEQRTGEEVRPDPENVDLGQGSREEQQGGSETAPKKDEDKDGPIAPRPAR